jgi:hypothetical protein
MISEEDLRLFDLITYSYKAFALINDLNNKLISDMTKKITGSVTQFYFDWCDYRIDGKREYPFNPGIVWMITSVIIVTSKERWLDHLPDTPLSKSNPDWGLQEAQLCYPANPDPSIKEVVHKIRNAISHSDFDFIVGRENTPWSVFLKESQFIFRDTRKNPFQLKISVMDLSYLNAKIYTTIYPILREYDLHVSEATQANL